MGLLLLLELLLLQKHLQHGKQGLGATSSDSLVVANTEAVVELCLSACCGTAVAATTEAARGEERGCPDEDDEDEGAPGRREVELEHMKTSCFCLHFLG